jgi:protein SCO1/2
MKLRMISRGIVATLVLVVGLVIVIHDRVEGQPALQLTGTSLGAVLAPDFTLTDPSGQHVSLKGLHGHPVVLTFLPTSCADTCVQAAQKLRATVDQLGSEAANVRWVVVSIDPGEDSNASAAAFAQRYKLQGRLTYLLGSQDQLAAVWQAYHVGVQAGANGTVTYTDALYVIDAQGRERVFFDFSFSPQSLASDLRTLLAAG